MQIHPKTSIKEFYRANYITEDEYELLIQMIDDRNKLSHIYKDEFLEEIHRKLTTYLTLMKKVLEVIKKAD